MLMALRGILVSLLGVYYFTFFKDYNNVKKSNKLDNISVAKVGVLGCIANFFDTLGIGHLQL